MAGIYYIPFKTGCSLVFSYSGQLRPHCLAPGGEPFTVARPLPGALGLGAGVNVRGALNLLL